MSKYIVSSLSKFSEYDNEIPRVDNVTKATQGDGE